MSQSIKLIGIGDNGQESLLPQYAQWIEESEVLVGGERILSFFPNYSGKKIVIKGGLKKVVEQLQDETRPTVVLASGDPLFYGMGAIFPAKSTWRFTHISVQFSLLLQKWGKAGKMPSWLVFMAAV